MESSTLAGDGRTVVYQGTGAVTQLAVDGTAAYLVDEELCGLGCYRMALHRVQLAGGRDDVIARESGATDLAVDAFAVYWMNAVGIRREPK